MKGFLAALFLLCWATGGVGRAAPPTPADLATRIDSQLAAAFPGGVMPAPEATDAEFLRRAYLDVVGRIPRVPEARRFLDSASPDKRGALVEELLSSPEYHVHAAQNWRQLLVPQATSNLRVQHLGMSVEAWVRDLLGRGAKDDEVVRRLLTARLDYLEWTADKRPSIRSQLSPVGFYQINDLKPETVSASVSRAFLGLKLECAQCHDHPFDRWTQQQAWETAAFFAGVPPLEPDIVPAPQLALRRTLKVAETDRPASARFLDGSEPAWGAEPDPRRTFAGWLTDRKNPYFAPVMANRIWARYFGVGLVDPPDDWGPHNPPSHPELLQGLAAAYAESGFDERYLARVIASTRAYRRSSRRPAGEATTDRLYAAMTVKPLSAEQLFDSLGVATGYRDPTPLSARLATGWPPESPRGQFLAKFGGGGSRTDAQVSILQALSLMNGAWTTRQTDPVQGEVLRAVTHAPFLTPERQVETLFLGTLSRRPTPEESRRYLAHVRDAGDTGQGLSDVLWVLINSEEFLVNR
jgi:hypothetical protein